MKIFTIGSKSPRSRKAARAALQLVLLFSLAILTWQCDGDEPNKVEQLIHKPEKPSFKDFQAGFAHGGLPYPLPAPGTDKSVTLDKKFIKAFLEDKKFMPALGERDVPDLADNYDAATFFTQAYLPTKDSAFYTYIIRKEDRGRYYYICTFTPGGEFINGMCLAFREEGGKTERTASINDDLSIQILQSDDDNQRQTRFYEMGPDGKLSTIRKNS